MLISIFTCSIKVQATHIIDYDWTFEKTNYNEGAGRNSVVVVSDKYYTWHIDYYDYINVINEYNKEGKLINTFEPAIEDAIVDLIYYDDTFIAIDRYANIYKLDKNFNIIEKATGDDDFSIVGSYDELKIANNKIYYIDKSDSYIYYTNYSLDKVICVDILDFETIDEILRETPFISATDKMYFKYIFNVYNNEADEYEEYQVTDIQKKNDLYYLTGFYVKEDGPISFIKAIDENLKIVWEDNSNMSVSLSISFYKDYLFTLYIAPDENYNTVRYIKIYDRYNNLIANEKIPLRVEEDEIPIALIPDTNGIVVKSIYHSLAPSTALALLINFDEIIIDKYIVNIYDINTKTDGNGTITVKDSAVAGDTISFTATPNENYILDKIIVKDSLGNIIKITDKTFIMPSSDVQIEATFTIKNPNTADNIHYIITILISSIILMIIITIKNKKRI